MIYFEILAIVLLTLMNGWLAMSELAVVSSRKSRLEHMAAHGRRGARAALRLMEEPSRFLSTVQIGITFVGIVAGAFSGATLGRRLGGWLNSIEATAPYGDAIGIGITVTCITYLTLILGELAPKRIALTHPEKIASIVANPMRMLSLVAMPLVRLLQVSTEAVVRLIGLSEDEKTTITEEELKSLIAEGTQAGVFVPQEKKLIEGVLRLEDRPVKVIMTPRSQIVWIDVNAGSQEIIRKVRKHRFSRIIVCENMVDYPVGIVQTKDILREALGSRDIKISRLMKPPLFVPESTRVLNLLNRFKNKKVHIALVVDEFGALEGLVTLTDVMEAIAGELPERGEEAEQRIVRRGERSWLVDATVPTDEVEMITGIILGKEVKTIAEFVLEKLGRIPNIGENFMLENARFEVVDMDGQRIDRIMIDLEPEVGEEAGG